MTHNSMIALSSIRIILVGTTHPGNLGAAARAMKTMGLRDLALVAPQCFPSVDATAMAAGADDLLMQAQVVDQLAPVCADCLWVVGTTARERGYSTPVLTPEAAAAGLLERASSGPVALVFGRESSGLSNAELDHCHALVRIPTAEDFCSLNLAAAVQVMSYVLRHTAMSGAMSGSVTPIAEPAQRPATSAELEGFLAHLEQVLTQIGFLDPAKPRQLLRRLRHVFWRAGLSVSEVQMLRGILTQIQRRGTSA